MNSKRRTQRNVTEQKVSTKTSFRRFYIIQPENGLADLFHNSRIRTEIAMLKDLQCTGCGKKVASKSFSLFSQQPFGILM